MSSTARTSPTTRSSSGRARSPPTSTTSWCRAARAADWTPDGGPTRVLVAPVTVTPTKPLTLSHIKGLLWVDALYKATTLVANVDYRYSLTTYNVTAQTLGFWAYLDRECEPTD